MTDEMNMTITNIVHTQIEYIKQTDANIFNINDYIKIRRNVVDHINQNHLSPYLCKYILDRIENEYF